MDEVPQDTECVRKAGILVKHKNLWFETPSFVYFNSRRVLGKSAFEKRQVTAERVRIWENARETGRVVLLPTNIEPTDRGEFDYYATGLHRQVPS